MSLNQTTPDISPEWDFRCVVTVNKQLKLVTVVKTVAVVTVRTFVILVTRVNMVTRKSVVTLVTMAVMVRQKWYPQKRYKAL